MALTSDINIIRESLTDAILNSIVNPVTGESDNIDENSIHPKIIKDGNIISSQGVTYNDSERKVLFSKDFKSILGFENDFLDEAINSCYRYSDGIFENPDFSLGGVTYTNSTAVVSLNNCVSGPSDNPNNNNDNYEFVVSSEAVNNYLSQYITFQSETTNVDSTRAEQILDTRVFELLPNELTRQQRINKFFSEFLQLVGDTPEFDLDVDGDNIADTWIESQIQQQQDLYNSNNSVIENPTDGNIVRLDRHAVNTTNQNKTLETLRNTLNNYLTDIDKSVVPDVVDDRPEYENRSDGYLKIRNLNQSILIRNEQGTDVGIIGNDINNPTYLQTGFTIAMWVRFLDKTGAGTLFNFGNPVRSSSPNGFRLETYTINKNDLLRPDRGYTWGEYIQSHTVGSSLPPHPDISENLGFFSEDHTFFKDNDYERFVRLIVRESNGAPRESCNGARQAKEGMIFSRVNHSADNKIPSNGTYPIIWPQDQNLADTYYPNRLLNYTRIPIDFDEWYYIVATYDPSIKEDESFDFVDTYAPDGVHTLSFFSEFWNGNVLPESQLPSDEQVLNNDNLSDTDEIGKYVTRSEYGNRCKVEFISKSDLLRARGFKPESNSQGATAGGNQVVGG